MLKRHFKVEEIGISNVDSSILLKGKNKPILDEGKGFICRLWPFMVEDRKEIVSLMEGQILSQSECFRSTIKLAEDFIKEMEITRKSEKQKSYYTSDLRFLRNGSIRGALPQASLMYVLACRGIGKTTDIYCDESLDKNSETSINHMIENNFVRFIGIEDITLTEKTHENHVNETEYERLEFERVLMTPKPFAFPDSIVYQKGSKKVGLRFPMNKATYEKVIKDHNLPKAEVSDPYNPHFLADSMSILYEFIKRSHIEVDSIYVDGDIESYRSMNFFRYRPKSAKIVLKKNGEKILSPALCEHALSLSYLESKDICVKDLTKSYLV